MGTPVLASPITFLHPFTMTPPRVIVVGGGLSGLSAAHTVYLNGGSVLLHHNTCSRNSQLVVLLALLSVWVRYRCTSTPTLLERSLLNGVAGLRVLRLRLAPQRSHSSLKRALPR